MKPSRAPFQENLHQEGIGYHTLIFVTQLMAVEDVLPPPLPVSDAHDDLTIWRNPNRIANDRVRVIRRSDRGIRDAMDFK